MAQSFLCRQQAYDSFFFPVASKMTTSATPSEEGSAPPVDNFHVLCGASHAAVSGYQARPPLVKPAERAAPRRRGALQTGGPGRGAAADPPPTGITDFTTITTGAHGCDVTSHGAVDPAATARDDTAF